MWVVVETAVHQIHLAPLPLALTQLAAAAEGSQELLAQEVPVVLAS